MDESSGISGTETAVNAGNTTCMLNIPGNSPNENYTLRKSVTGTFHQGDPRFGLTAGTQCASNALCSICWSVIRNVSLWKSFDLDHVLVSGDQMYKSLGMSGYLGANDLPPTVLISDESFDVLLLHNETGQLMRDFRLNSLRDIFRSQSSSSVLKNASGVLIFIEGYTISIIPHKRYFYLFDSHSRNDHGLMVTNGTSVLLQFSSFLQLENYLRTVYLLFRDKLQLFFEIQFVKISIGFQSQQDCLCKFHNLQNSALTDSRKRKNKDCEIGSASKVRKLYPHHETYRKCPEIAPKNQFSCNAQQKNAKKKEQVRSGYEDNIGAFKRDIQCGPFFFCVICNRCFFKQTVKIFKESNYNNLPDSLVTSVTTYNGKQYICRTCDKSVKKGHIPCQAVTNKLEIYNLPNRLSNLNRLEKVLVSKRLLFKKVTIMPKGSFPKVKGAICNIPVDATDVCNLLPRAADCNGIVIVKLKRKLNYRGHVYLQPVRPEILFEVLWYLKNNNHLYNDIQIDVSNIPENLLDFQDKEETKNLLDLMINNLDDPIFIELENSCVTEILDSMNEIGSTDKSNDNQDLEDQENHLDSFRMSADETIFVSDTPSPENTSSTVEMAPGEGKTPLSIYEDKFCEELAFPHLFPTGKFGYQVKREVPISPVRYFNQRLFHYSQKFASDPDYLFFAHSVLLNLNLNSKINIAIRKTGLRHDLNAGVLSKNFKDTVKDFISSEKAFSFMSTIKGTPAYWKKFLYDVLAMVKQLGIPTFFLTLSCADLRWNELISIISKLNKIDLQDDDINKLSYHERCRHLNSNPILLARHFQERVHLFFKHILLNGPLGKTTHYVIRTEFQARGSPHVHCFLWMENALLLTKQNENAYANWIDSVVSAELPDVENNTELHNLVKTFQLHRHSKTCRKYKNQNCRFHFGKYFTDQTIISKPLSDDLSALEKQDILKSRDELLLKVKAYINSELNPAKKNFFDKQAENYTEIKSIAQILQELEIPKEEYEKALSTSSTNDYEIYLKRSPDSCFVNNYFDTGLLAWEANLDLQPVFNQYKAVSYVCAYLSKTEDACSEAMKIAIQEAFEKSLSNYEQMRLIAKAYASKREMSVYEAAYHVSPGLNLHETSTAVIFANSNTPEKRYRMIKNVEDLQELPEDSTDIFKKNMLDRYVDRPNSTFANGKFRCIDSLCYASFLRHFYLSANVDFNDCQPNDLSEALNSNLSNPNSSLPKCIPLMSSKEKLKRRNTPCILRYHVPNQHKRPDDYAHHLLFMFFPFRDESELKSGNPPTYINKLNESNVLEIVNLNKSSIEPYAELVDNAFATLNETMYNIDSFGQQENDEVEYPMSVLENENNSNEVLERNCSSVPTLPVLTDTDINLKINSLNKIQRQIFDAVYKWARDTVKYFSCKRYITIKPFHIFITGDAGCGKSHLVRTIYHSVNKLLLRHCSNPDKPRILLLCPTGVAAINIGGTTIHSGLGINCMSFLRLQDKHRQHLRNLLSEVHLVIIDEISMVAGELFFQVHQRLLEIFDCRNDEPFAGKSVIVCGDFYQLPPINLPAIYRAVGNFSSVKALLCLELWHMFEIAELKEVMRQKGDTTFVSLLNKIRVGAIDKQVEDTLRSRFIDQNRPDYPRDALHIFAENIPANNHNEMMLNALPSNLVCIKALDLVPEDSGLPPSKIISALNGKVRDTGNLAYELKLKLGARIMLTSNIDIEDRLINGQVGTIKYFKTSDSVITAIYVQFDDQNAGVKASSLEKFALDNRVVPILRHESSFNIVKDRPKSPTVKRTQFPLALSWACTVHKVQGISLQKAVISFDLYKQKGFKPGQMYVALSRVTSLDGLFLIGKYSRDALKENKAAGDEYERLRNENPFIPIKYFISASSTLTFSLLNTRSLNLHARDIRNDFHLTNFDILFLTETQLSQSHNFSEIRSALSCFQVDFNNIGASKFENLAVCFTSSVELLAHERFPGMSVIKLRKISFSAKELTVGLLYRQKNRSAETFTDFLEGVLQSHFLDIVLGDFNIDFLCESSSFKLKNIMSCYEQIVTEPTHLDGSILDHLYVHKSLTHQNFVSTAIKAIPFTDHDAVLCQIKSKTCD